MAACPAYRAREDRSASWAARRTRPPTARTPSTSSRAGRAPRGRSPAPRSRAASRARSRQRPLSAEPVEALDHVTDAQERRLVERLAEQLRADRQVLAGEAAWHD